MSRVSDPAVRIASDGKPKFVMTGVELPNGRVRLYASRDIPPGRLQWGMRDVNYASAWHVDADMVNVLIIDAGDWAEAFTRAFEIWANADRDEAEGKRNALAASEAYHGARGSIESPRRREADRRAARAGRGPSGPPALPPGSTSR